MTVASDGERIALERIAKEADERTGYLDLGMLGLTDLPAELFELKHLRGLNLGSAWRDGSANMASRAGPRREQRSVVAGKVGEPSGPPGVVAPRVRPDRASQSDWIRQP